ncbi:hypothetical protein DOJK_01371 [Patescibacteria group bacterium]|nr:hypothetical protein DOJK_01371 [Patescibacteria group bacterium]
MNLNLEPLKYSETLFKRLNKGEHINRHTEAKLWLALEKYGDDYKILFNALGFELVIDARGFAYFKTEQTNNGKYSQQIALFILLLFEYQADKGLYQYQFEQWKITKELISELWQKNRALLEAEDIRTMDDLIDILDRACRVGFMKKSSNIYSLLAATHRYLDLFLELQAQNQTEE